MGHIKKQYDVLSQSSKGGKTYKVTEYTDGTWACACMNWTRTMPRQDCKHILTQQKANSNGFQAAPQIAGVRVVANATGRKFRD